MAQAAVADMVVKIISVLDTVTIPVPVIIAGVRTADGGGSI